jgi:hypothetical protein
MSDKSEAALQKPNLCVGCQVLREIAYPTTSPDLQEIRYLHPGLLGDLMEEYSYLASKSGIAVARRWYWRQTTKTVAHLAATGFHAAPWSTTAVVVVGFCR